jgi:hypothetical protein
MSIQKISRRTFLSTVACGFAATLLVMAPVAAKDKSDDEPEQGSSTEEIAALKARPLPQPGTLKVAILPFWDSEGSISHVRMATAANYLLWQREGFQMIPIQEGFKALEADKEVERGMALRRNEAARIGKAAGADWAVYGEVRDLRHYTKKTMFKEAKYLIAGVRIAVVDVNTGETVYWHQRSDKTGGTGIGTMRKAGPLKRRGVVIASLNALKPLYAAFPAHDVKGNPPDSGDIATFVNEVWPGDDRDD